MKIEIVVEVPDTDVPAIIGKQAEIAHRLSEIDGVTVVSVEQQKPRPNVGTIFTHNNARGSDPFASVVDKVVRAGEQAYRQRGSRQ